MQNLIRRIDEFQQRHHTWGTVFAIIKKFGDDNGSYQAALITYYGFLSLFPLLLVLFTVMQIVFKNNAQLQHQVASSINEYLPVVGQELQKNIHSMRSAGVGLVVGLLVALYGARGGADVVRNMLNDVWQVPRNRRAGVPKSLFQTLSIMAAAAVGFVAVVLVSTFSSVLGHAQWVKVAVNFAGFMVAAAALLVVCNRATSRRVRLRDMVPGAIGAALVTQALVTFGGILVRHQLKGVSSFYGIFAVVLGLIFWLYLIAQVLVYATEFDSVRHLKLRPRAIQLDKPTEADLRAYGLYQNVQNLKPLARKDHRFRH